MMLGSVQFNQQKWALHKEIKWYYNILQSLYHTGTSDLILLLITSWEIIHKIIYTQ